MAITLKDVKQFESQEILRMMLPRLDSLYKSVDYIGFTKEQFYQVALEQIDKSKKMYDGDIVYREYLKQQINLALINHLKNSLPNSEKAIVIINNYINKYLKRRLTYDRALNNLKKLNAFFELYDYIPEPYVLARLIEKSPIFLRISF